MTGIMQEAADAAGVPEDLREEIIEQVREEAHDRLVVALADRVHEAFMNRLARDGKYSVAGALRKRGE